MDSPKRSVHISRRLFSVAHHLRALLALYPAGGLALLSSRVVVGFFVILNYHGLFGHYFIVGERTSLRVECFFAFHSTYRACGYEMSDSMLGDRVRHILSLPSPTFILSDEE